MRREKSEVTYAGVDYAVTREAGLFLYSQGSVYYVLQVLPGSAAERLGMRRGDFIVPSKGERLDVIVQHVIEGEEVVVARTNQKGIAYDLVLPNDQWLGDVAAEEGGE